MDRQKEMFKPACFQTVSSPKSEDEIPNLLEGAALLQTQALGAIKAFRSPGE